ncbi:MAG: amidohydrolase family protein [Armatimonadota bacterium]
MPAWAQEGNALVERLCDPECRARVRAEMLSSVDDWDAVRISNARHGRIIGLSVGEIARTWKCEPVDAAIDLLIDDSPSIVYFVIDEADMRMIAAHPRTLVGTDATARATSGPMSEGKPHPRAYGAFPRFLAESGLPIAEAVAKMTGRSAERIGLMNRGVLAEENFADIVVFDPARIRDAATYDEPHRRAEGIRFVLVNGCVAVEDGEFTGALPGRVLRRNSQ